MPVKTELNKKPYWNDYSQDKDFYKVLFSSGSTIQTREMNELQDILQKQIERFGDHVLVSGTLVSGCNFQFYNPIPYVKISDITEDGNVTIPYKYVNYNVINETSGLIAQVTDYYNGYESTSPDLKTLYLAYKNFGANGTTTKFTSGDVLKVYNPIINGIEKISIDNGGIGFSNTDTLVSLPKMLLSVSTGTLVVGDNLINNKYANVEIVALDSTTYANNGYIVATFAPRTSDLANGSVNSAFWTINAGDNLTNPGSNVIAYVIKGFGGNFRGKIVTDNLGTVSDIQILDKGAGYTEIPYVTIRSINNNTGYPTLTLSAKNYLDKIVVSNLPNSVGNGYAFGITEGVIYQKGYFLRTVPQKIVVSKYDTLPDNVAVGFITNEEIINPSMDDSLYDNANDTKNYQAPGADRLKLVPQLKLVASANATNNSEFFTICDWKEGKPYLQKQETSYNVLSEELKTRTAEASGDFVTDPFLVTTRAPSNTSTEGQYYNLVIDPGTAYIGGNRVSTQANYNLDVEKGIATSVHNNHTVSLNYGNYIMVNEMGGSFGFNVGGSVSLYNSAKTFLSNTALVQAQNTDPVGTSIGTANIRSVVHEDGTPGQNNATYRLYLFNVQMSAGKNFRDVRSVYYNGTKKAIADIVLDIDPASGNSQAFIKDASNTGLIFDAGVESLKNANTVVYTYRTIDTTLTVANTGILSKDISASPDEIFPYSGNLTSTQMKDLIVVPLTNDLTASAATTGTVSVNTTSPNVVGSSTTFLTDYSVGDYVTVSANATGGTLLGQVKSVVNNTLMVMSTNGSFANAAAVLYQTYPKDVPVPFGYRSSLSANVNNSQNLLTLNFGKTFGFATANAVSVATNIQRNNPTQNTKTVNRDRFVKMCLANNAANTVGPWCIGVPDVFRLKGVYIGNSSVTNTSSNYVTNFYIDHNQTPDFYDLGWLYLKPKSNLNLTSSDYLLVQFDYFSSSGAGFYDTISYISANSAAVFENDSLSLSSLGSNVNSFEIPEVFTNDGKEIDLLGCFDFRPYAANTVSPAATYGTAPLNPSSTVTLNTAAEKKFPVPDSTFICTAEYYMGRKDSVFIDKNTKFTVLNGEANTNIDYQLLPRQPENTMKIVDLDVPPYPNLPVNLSDNQKAILNTGIANQKFLTTRQKKRTVKASTANNSLPYKQPMVYTQADIGKIDRRLQDVEYYIELSSLETGMAQKVIPSSTDPSLNRFKNGIFVDDFTTTRWSALSDPQYNAEIEDNCLVPPKVKWDINLIGPNVVPWLDYPIIQQEISTVGGINDPESLGPVCALNMGNTVAYTQLYRNATDLNNVNDTDVVSLAFANSTAIYESVNYLSGNAASWMLENDIKQYTYNVTKGWNLFSDIIKIIDPTMIVDPVADNVAGPSSGARAASSGARAAGSGTSLTLGSTHSTRLNEETIAKLVEWIKRKKGIVVDTSVSNTPANTSVITQLFKPEVDLYFYNYDKPVLIEIYQGDTLVANTTSAVALTNTEITVLKSDKANQWFNDYPDYFLKDPIVDGNGYASYAGKISFNYDPTAGSNFSIKTKSSTYAYRWRWMINYPINGLSAGCVPTLANFDVEPDFAANYKSYAFMSYCGNGVWQGEGSVNILAGVTAQWTPIPVPVPTTSIVPISLEELL